MKLFKKVSAAILAGVMALSMMVGCAGNVTPGTPVTPPTTPPVDAPSVVDEIINQMNTTTTVSGATKLVNNKDLANQASALLDVVLYGDLQDTIKNDWTTQPGRVGLNANVIDTVFLAQGIDRQNTTNQLDASKVYFTCGRTLASHNSAATALNGAYVDLACLTYENDDATKTNLANLGAGFIATSTKVGVASKTAGAYTYVLIVTNK